MKKEVNKLLKKILLLTAPFVVLLGFTEYMLRQIPNAYTTKKADFERQLDSIEVLVLGSSQSLYDVDPALFSAKGFNLSDVNQSLFFDTHITLKYLPDMKNLECIMISVSYFSFWYQLYDDVESWRDYYYAYFWKIRYPELRWYDPKLYSLIMLYSPRKTLEYARQFFRVHSPENLLPNGWLKMDTIPDNPNISEELGRERVKLHNSGIVGWRYNEVYNLLDQFIEECKEYNIRVVLITPPVYSTYYKYTDPDINRINEETIEKLSEKHNLEYYNYFKDNRFLKFDFYDNDHLNCKGAEKFSKIIDSEIIASERSCQNLKR